MSFNRTIGVLCRSVALLLCMLSPIAITAQGTAAEEPEYAEEVFLDMEFDANIATPHVADDIKPEIRRYVKSVAESHKKDFTIDLMRNGEVMVVTFLTDDLFLPNDTILMSTASKQLNKILPLVKDPMMYKLVFAVHTDDTGSDLYCDRLSTARLNSVYDWLLDAIDRGAIEEDLVIVPYSMAASDPLIDNDTREHRRQNRRVEFFLIPGPKMMQRAKNKTLNR